MLIFLTIAALLFSAPAPDAPPDTAAVQAAAEAALAAQFPADAHRLVVRVVRTGGEDAAAPLRVVIDGTRGLPGAHTQVKVLAGDDAGGWREAGRAMLYVAHYDTVALARADARQDDPVAPADLHFAWIETTRFPGTPLRAADVRALTAQGDVFATRPLREGRPLRAGDLRPAYAAETGAAVTMQYRRGVVALRLSCKAREAGFVGDAIRLYAPDTRTTYRARLTGDGAAEWIETL